MSIQSTMSVEVFKFYSSGRYQFLARTTILCLIVANAKKTGDAKSQNDTAAAVYHTCKGKWQQSFVILYLVEASWLQLRQNYVNQNRSLASAENVKPIY